MKWKFWKRQKPSDGKQASPTATPTGDQGGSARLYYGDQPILEPRQDRFDRWPFAQRIAETIAKRQDPSSLVIGIYGPWGDGKTSVLHLIEHALGKYPSVVPVRFNPWLFRSQEVLLQSFFADLARAVDASPFSGAEKVGKAIRVMGQVFSLASVSVPGVSIDPGKAIERFGEKISTRRLEECRDRVQKLLGEAKCRVVVFVDDIDRLDKDEIHAILKLVKLSAAIQHVTYVLAFDDRHVAAALTERFGSARARAGEEFLEKIVQVPLFLPPADSIALRQLAFDGVNEAIRLSEQELSEEHVSLFVNLFVQGLEPGLQTPRHAVRYANNLIYALPVLKGETNPLDLLLIEGVRSFYPELYLGIRDNLDLLLRAPSEYQQRGDRQKEIEALVGSGMVGRSDRGVRLIRKLIEYLFPRAGTSGYGSDWEAIWARQKRICSDQYAWRYFRYVVSRRDVSDASLDEYLVAVQTLAAEAADRGWERVVSRESAPQVIKKLRLREDEINPLVLASLAGVVARHGDRYPHEQGMFAGFAATDAQAAILVSKLVRRIEPMQERERVAEQVVEQATPLSFAVSVFGWLRTGKEEPETERILTPDGEKRLGQVLATRIRHAGKETWFPGQMPNASRSLLRIWQEDGEGRHEVSDYLQRNFIEDPRRVLTFLGTFLDQAWGMESGLPARSEFRKEAYDAVARLVPATVVYEHLRGLYGASMDSASYHGSSDRSIEEMLAAQFATIHRGEAGGKGESPSSDETDKNTADKAN